MRALEDVSLVCICRGDNPEKELLHDPRKTCVMLPQEASGEAKLFKNIAKIQE